MSQTPTQGLSAADRLLHQRILVLGQEVDDAIANKICAELLLLSAEDPHRDISLYVNSPGGSVSAGLAIYDTMRLIPNDVSTLAMGLAASMGQFLLTAGTPGKRFALPNSRVLLHQGSAGIGGTAVDIEIQAENLEHMKNVMMRITAEHTGQPVEKVERDALRDRWFTAEEARDYGFVDHVLTEVASVVPSRPASRSGLGREHEQLHDPERRRAHGARRARRRRLQPAAHRPHRLHRHRGRRRRRNVVIAQLLHLESESPDSPIHLYLNSPGGAVTSVLAIYDTLQFVRSEVATTCVGQVGSSSALLLAAGAPGRRTLLPHARVVLDQPAGGGRGTLPDLAVQAKEIVRLRGELEQLMAEHTGRSRRADPHRHRP